MPMKVADSVMMAGVFDDGVLMALTLYQIVPSYGANGLEVRFSYAFMSPDPIADPIADTILLLLLGLLRADDAFRSERGF